MATLSLQLERLGPSGLAALPSCTKTISVRYSSVSVVLSLGPSVSLEGGREISLADLPKSIQTVDGAAVTVRRRSSVFVSVLLPGGVEVWWDGRARLYVDAPREAGTGGGGRFGGLCGNLNGRAADDSSTPEGDVECQIAAFAERSKLNDPQLKREAEGRGKCQHNHHC